MKKRFLSLFLTLLLTFACFADFTVSATTGSENTEKDSVTLIACSDYQNSSGNSAGALVVGDILSKIQTAGYEKADAFLAMGDYDYDMVESADTPAGIASLKEVVQSTYAEMEDDKMIFVQGNHDAAGAEGLSPSGANDTEDYGVYVIHHDEYPWFGGKAADVQNTANRLASYLQAKVDEGNEKPIFVVSHLPLHNSSRTRNNGDSWYAEYIFEVLNEYASAGQNIIYMFGHNHNSYGYDDYLGCGSVYLTKGDTILITKPNDVRGVPKKYELQFTYMNAGYVGYNASGTQGADRTLTMTVFQITDNLVKVERYSTTGLHNMKSEGVWANNSALKETKDIYGVEDSYLEKVYESPQIIGGAAETDGNVRVCTSNLTGLAVGERMSAKDDTVHSAYVSYEIETTGYMQGSYAIVQVTLPKTAGFDTTKPVYMMDKDTGDITIHKISGGEIQFETEHLGDFELAQFKAVSSVSTGKTIYRYVTDRDRFTDGKTYMIVSANTVGEAYAMKNENGEAVTKARVEIKSDSEGLYVDEVDNTVVWKYLLRTAAYARGVGNLCNQATGQYLYAGSGSQPLAKGNAGLDHAYWSISSKYYVYTFENLAEQDGTRWSLKFNENFVLDTSTDYQTNKVYVFEEVTTNTEDAVYMDSSSGRVKQYADSNERTGSKIIFSYSNGKVEVVDVTLSMLRDAQGNAVDTNMMGQQTDLRLYYNNTLILDNYSLRVYHENGSHYMDVAEYRSGDVFTYPEESGYVFAGWYEDAAYNKPLGKDVKSGWAYAKFVPAEVLDAKYQIATGTTLQSEETGMRLVTTVDSTAYQEVGFRIYANGKESKPCVSNTVYDTIIGNVDSVRTTYCPNKTFDITSRYFVVYAITGIPNSEFETDITIKTIWTTLDGTTVCGRSKVMTIFDTIQNKEVNSQTYTLTSATSFITIYPEAATVGQTVTFRVRTEETAPIALWVQGIYKNDAGNDTYSGFFERAYNSISDGVTITTTITKDCNYIRLQLQTRETAYGAASSTWTGGKVVISNFEISQ